MPVSPGAVLSGQTEGVPAHGVQHVKAAHAHLAGDYVRGDIVMAVTDGETVTRRIREEVEAIEGLAAVLAVFSLVKLGLAPPLLPFLLELLGLVVLWDLLLFHRGDSRHGLCFSSIYRSLRRDGFRRRVRRGLYLTSLCRFCLSRRLSCSIRLRRRCLLLRLIHVLQRLRIRFTHEYTSNGVVIWPEYAHCSTEMSLLRR